MGIIRARSTSLDRFVFIFLGGRGRGGLFYFEGKLSCVFELKILDELTWEFKGKDLIFEIFQVFHILKNIFSAKRFYF